jgi:phosphatidylethanolamine-binding protein (PEBP) family uncharacterized protein
MWTSSLPVLAAAAAVGLAMVAAPGEAYAFSARFSWVGIPACQAISPAFELGGVPPGTKQLRFTMKDLDVPTFHHGGSTIAYQSDAVKKGAIRYTGPCPPDGERHRYRWIIEALDATGKVMGTATATAPFPP